MRYLRLKDKNKTKDNVKKIQNDELLPENISQVIEEKVGIQIRRQILEFEGPIPHPSILKGYNDIDDGFADRIIKMAEEQQKHRIELENKVIDSKKSDSRLGMVLGFIIAFMTVVIGGFLIYKDKNAEGFSLIITSIGSLAACFLYATNSNKKEREEKEKNN